MKRSGDVFILGISALYHDSAACLIKNGEIIAAVQEERFTRVKHDPSFPVNSIRYCIESAGITPGEISHVVFYEKPILKFDRLIETYLCFAPRGFKSFFLAMSSLLGGKLSVGKEIDKALKSDYDGEILYIYHHQSHAASAFFPSPFESAAIVTADGVGEWTTTSIGVGRGNNIRLLKEIRFPHSLGLLYTAFTYYCGFKVNSGEYKLMGLAPYGKPVYKQKILDNLIAIERDGSFRLNMDYFDYCHGLTMINWKFCRLFGSPPRKPDEPIEERHMDIAASIQCVTEEIMMAIAEEARRVTGEENLCLAGGVALNCVANGRILKEGHFKGIWVQPAAGDAGGALGAALFVWHQVLGKRRNPEAADSMKGAFLGPSYSDEYIKAFLEKESIPHRHYDDLEELYAETVKHLEQKKVVGWFQGRMEYGPRALGARSILADPRDEGMQSRVNLKIKFREGFRPFAPVVLEERTAEYFDFDRQSPYMLFTAPVAAEQRLDLAGRENDLHYMDRLRLKHSLIPAVTHVDYSARIQTCDIARNPRLFGLLKAWERRTGCGVLLNTSFNVRGEPIVRTPEEAYNCFMGTDMDLLVMERFILLKEEQPRERLKKGW